MDVSRNRDVLAATVRSGGTVPKTIPERGGGHIPVHESCQPETVTWGAPAHPKVRCPGLQVAMEDTTLVCIVHSTLTRGPRMQPTCLIVSAEVDAGRQSPCR